VLDFLICVQVFLGVSDLLIFDRCVAVSGFVYTLHGLKKLFEDVAFQTKVMLHQHQSPDSFRLQSRAPHRDGISSASENMFHGNCSAWKIS
jgi:hypothetical protein